jgi:hypothetical protein
MGFCSSCDRLKWHKSSGECRALSATQHVEDGGGATAAATAVLLIRTVLRARQPNDEAACFWDLTGEPEELNATQCAFLEDVMALLAPAISDLKTEAEQLRQGLAKIALNAHDFGAGRALWPIAALGNHSCAPSAYMTTHAKRGVGLSVTLRALRNIRAGDAVTYTYRPLGGFAAAERKEQLRSIYGWECQCEV